MLAILVALVGYTIWDKYQSGQATAIDADEKYAYEAFNIELPDEFSFCGEAVPMKDPDVRERFDREMHVNVYFHSNTILVMKRAYRWLPQIEQILKEEGLPDELKYLVAVESAFTNAVSPAGAAGFWQIMEGTGREMGLRVNEEVDERLEPLKATRAACKYLKQAHQALGSWTLVAASYNMGISGVENALKRQKVNSFYDLSLNSQTARYVFRILAFKEIMENPEKYRFNLQKRHLYEPEEFRKVTVTTSIPDLIDFALQQGINLKLLRLHNPWLKADQLQVAEGESFDILIPSGAGEVLLEGDAAPAP